MPTEVTPEGKIVAFYSYSGGMDRTLAMIRTAGFMANRGKRIAMVDFDLPVLGMSSLLHQATSGATNTPGISAFYANTWNQLISQDIERYSTSIPNNLWKEENNMNGTLDVIPACNLQNEELEGGSLYQAEQLLSRLDLLDPEAGNKLAANEVLMQQLKQRYDVTLIDTPAGFSTIAGMVMRQMADCVAFFVEPNNISIYGTRQVLPQLESLMIDHAHYIPRLVVTIQNQGSTIPVSLAQRLGLNTNTKELQLQTATHNAENGLFLGTPGMPDSKLFTEYGLLAHHLTLLA